MVQFSEETKERVSKVIDISRVAIHYGYLPLIIYLGYTYSEPKPTLFRVTNSGLVYAVDRSSSRLGGSLRIIRKIFYNEGGSAAFYRGLTPNLIGNSTSWGLYFLCYSSLKDSIRIYHKERGQILTSSDYLLASGSAGVITSVLTNPIWVIKTRMLSTGSHAPGAYASFTSGAKQIYQVEGIPGFYRGLMPALFGVSHGALQFMAYEQLKLFRLRSMNTMGSESSHLGAERVLSNVDFLAISGLSKVFAGSVTYPYQVIRSRLQTYEARLIYRGAIDVFSQVWAKEGIAGFYKGLGPNLFRVLPSTWVTFLVYENTKVYLSRLAQNPWDTSY
ncbi:unnamed protein product [Penicillium nalgiovense]|uniref:Mitochondrial thiamine pyrophosphate carrier 1 n=1 Tax=Penicillium nalgiovense TaxID=60175 RepID=A0A9W4HK59_PENNA|nr:unnamed protein product [Penicillium nalgiovense]CAG7964955.1 unnamed protein product [Penicillium nalgiovense]CAG7969130.1 unnamed protein product [Penicillium nalgiovense]CAG8002476.1 unnamed protein product [Penicillium nalgiovense]CAG8018048.1 unnamed protein product [Penicillium nalgiovense]